METNQNLLYLCRMNWVKVVLALYITFLACLPCSDIYAQSEPGTASVSAQADDRHQEETDICSPLCICNCCAGVSQIPQAAAYTIAAPEFYSTDFNSLYQEKHLSVYASIWQPPKV